MIRVPARCGTVIAVVVVIHAPPELAALGPLSDAGAHGDVLSVELDRDRVGMGAEVVVPGRVMTGTGLGGNDMKPPSCGV